MSKDGGCNMITELAVLLPILAIPGTHQRHAELVDDAIRYLQSEGMASNHVTIDCRYLRIEGDVEIEQLSKWEAVDEAALAMAGKGGQYRKRIHGAWEGAAIAGLAYVETLDGSESVTPQVALYWDGNAGIRVGLDKGGSNYIQQYAAIGQLFLPHELYGYYANMPLATMIEYAAQEGDLQISRDGNTMTMSLPCNPGLLREFGSLFEPDLIPTLELGFELEPMVRLKCAYYVTQRVGQYSGYEVTQWNETDSGDVYPAGFDYYVFLSPVARICGSTVATDARLVYTLSANTGPIIDGMTVLKMAGILGWIELNGLDYINASGAEGLIANVKDEVDRLSGMKKGHEAEEWLGTALAGVVDLVAQLDERRIRGMAVWPSMSYESVKTEICGKNGMFNAAEAKCGQICCALLVKLVGGHVAMSDICRRYPADAITIHELETLLGEEGMEYRAVERAVLEEEGTRPIIAILGPGGAPMHAGVAVPHDGKYILWAPGRGIALLSSDALRAISTPGVFLVPKDYVRQPLLKTVLFVIAGGMMVGALALMVTKRNRALSRSSSIALVFLTCLAIGACGDEGARADDGLIAFAKARVAVGVDFGHNSQFTLDVCNVSDEIVHITRVSPPCSCIRVEHSDTVVGIGEARSLRFSAFGAVPGLHSYDLPVLATAGNHQQCSTVTVEIDVRNRIFIEPSQLVVRGSTNGLGENIFHAYVVTDCLRQVTTEDLHWDSDLPHLSLEVLALASNKFSGDERLVKHEFRCTWDLSTEYEGKQLVRGLVSLSGNGEEVLPRELIVQVEQARGDARSE